MKKINLEVQLKNYIITDLNYKFDENILPFLVKNLKDKNYNQDGNEYEFLSNIEDRNAVKIAIHKELKELIIIVDTQVKEYINKESLPEEFNADEQNYILKDLEISIMFKFDLEIISDISSYNKEDLTESIMSNIEDTVINTCRQHMVNTIKALTSLDYNTPITIDFPNIEIKG